MYTYKGVGVERETKHLLNQYHDFSKWIDGYNASVLEDNNIVSVVNAGRGQFSMLFALVHPEMEVHSYVFNRDDETLAKCCVPMPVNLHIHYCKDAAEAMLAAKDSNTIDMTEIIIHNKKYEGNL